MHCLWRYLSSIFMLSYLFIVLPVWADFEQAKAQLPTGTRSGLVSQLLNEQQTVNQYTDGYFPPASTLKIITALASQLELGEQFRFTTELRADNNQLALIFSGDPTLTTANLLQLFSQYRSKRGRKISGDIWLDISQFSGYQRAVGWPWDSLGVCYSAPVSAVNLDGNCIQASIYTQDNGSTRVYVPPHYPVHVSSEAKTVSQALQQSLHCDLELIATPNNHYQLSGCLAEREQPLPLRFAVQNPELYAQRVIHQLLRQLGIHLEGDIKIGQPPEIQTMASIAIHRSAALPELLKIMLQDSDNLIADSLTKTLGQHFFLQPGSFANGTEAIKQIIFANTGIDLQDAQLVDGSGLSRNNRLRLESMRQILAYLAAHDQQLSLLSLLPTAGKSGTLLYRRSMRHSSVRGQLIAKSGSLYGTHNMAGFVVNEQGKPLSLFIQYVTDYFPSTANAHLPIEPPITQFELRFYQDVINMAHGQ
ncbi:serine-type D-Ala-D-Ala carboxypeptidase [Vibrio metschnikovii]|uniref:serine-type D-Ala-D-Ala carboxypeptidase n=1 Tax=Vibrio metschnikovii TaxID=28172 RepID=UPI001C2F20A4|nr:serine-type D-Ala-D-Ala carboxypeptidase [Vibrio metschnikovii]MDA3139381.1 serine-type D-Ala-D-Ala carboxypeptidase [Vibrio metschnikovii]